MSDETKKTETEVKKEVKNERSYYSIDTKLINWKIILEASETTPQIKENMAQRSFTSEKMANLKALYNKTAELNNIRIPV